MISTQLAAASSAEPEGLANEIIIPRRKQLTPLISHRVNPNPNTNPGAGSQQWQRCGQGAAARPARASLGSRRLGAVYGEFTGLGDTLFLHVAIVTDTIIKLSLHLAEEMDLSEAIILASASLMVPRCPPRGRQRGAEPSRGDGAPRRRLRRGHILLTGCFSRPRRRAGCRSTGLACPHHAGSHWRRHSPSALAALPGTSGANKSPLRTRFQPSLWLPPAAPAFPLLLPL